MDPLYKLLPNGFKICPYDHSHIIIGKRFITHLLKCSKSSRKKANICPWNAQHHVVEPNDFEAHKLDCDNRVFFDQMVRGVISKQDVQNQLARSLPAIQFRVSAPEEFWSSDEETLDVKHDLGVLQLSGVTGEQDGQKTLYHPGMSSNQTRQEQFPRCSLPVTKAQTSPTKYGWSSDEEETVIPKQDVRTLYHPGMSSNQTRQEKFPRCSLPIAKEQTSPTKYGWSSDEEETVIPKQDVRAKRQDSAGSGLRAVAKDLRQPEQRAVASSLHSVFPDSLTRAVQQPTTCESQSQATLPSTARKMAARSPEDELSYLVDAFATTSFANSINGIELMESFVRGLMEDNKLRPQ